LRRHGHRTRDDSIEASPIWRRPDATCDKGTLELEDSESVVLSQNEG